MRRFTGACFVACAGTAAFAGCDLDLQPFTPDAGEPAPVFDSGDGTVDANKPSLEDASIPEDTGAPDATVDGGDGGTRKHVFVTSTTGNGGFGASGVVALTGADQRCQTAATAANLKGTFVAWISSNNPATTAISRITKDVGPWYLVNGPMVFANKQAITTTGPLVPIDKDETGKTVGAPDTVWTGTQTNGTADNQVCATVLGGWTSAQAGPNGRAGNVKEKNASWTQSVAPACNTAHHLYCFEQ